jgi:hypothetical protein
MAGHSFRDRFFTPRVARAITAPSGILLGGAVAAGAIVAGVPVAAAVALAPIAWGAKVLWSVPRTGRRERIDPFTLQEPWRRFVQEALQARNRFDEVVARTRSGPLRDNLAQVGARVEAAVEECWQIAKRGQTLDRARRDISAAAIDRQLAEVAGDSADPAAARVRESLLAQRATAERLDRVIQGAHTELRMLDARLDEAVVRTIELSAQASTDASVAGLGADVDSLVVEMEALRQAMDETSGAAQPGLGSGTDEG